MDDLVIYPNKTRIFLIALGGLLFFALGFYFVGEGKATGLTFWEIFFISSVGIPLSGFCLIYAIYRLVSRKPSVVISREGLFDNASAACAGMLKWEEIAEIYPYYLMGQRWLGIVPKDAEAVIARQPFLKRMLARINSVLVKSPFNIPQTMLSISVDELLEEIELRRTITT